MSVDTALVFRAIHRFGLGLRPGDLGRIGGGVRDLLREEVKARQVATLTGLPFMTTAEVGPALRRFQEAERMQREARSASAGPAPPAGQPAPAQPVPAQPAPVQASPAPALPAQTPPMAAAPAQTPAPQAPGQRQPAQEPPLPQRVYREEVRADFHARLEPLGGISERLVAFWANHFAVSVNKGPPVRSFAGAMVREAIRPHVYGRFSDMLLAVATHPAMIIFLDNQQSIGPNSPAGQRRGRGLNENLAREILELHTLGVAGGYTQADVTSLARIITGWSLVPPNATDGAPGTFRYNPNLHEPGDHVLLGKTYREAGFNQGKTALEDLAGHASTTQHIARKLARHFIADEPPPSLVARLARTFRDSNGDLQQVAAALVDSPESWSAPLTKMRTPQEFLVASARALGRKPDFGQILGPLGAMGQQMWLPGGPNGFPDNEAAWASPEGLKTRLDVAAAIARQSAAAVDPRDFLDQIFGAAASTETRQAVLRAESRYQAVALALMAPEFQRR